MAVDIRMPELGSDMTEADLVQWLVAVGDEIGAGDLIAEIETDKATVEFESPVAGVVAELCVPAPTPGVKVGELLARIEPGESRESRAPSEVAAAPLPADAAERAEAHPATPPAASGDGAHATRTPGAGAATALARRIADQRGVDLSELEGSGASGRITKADVERAGAAASTGGPSAKRADPTQAPPALSRMMRSPASAGSTSSGGEARSIVIEIRCEVDALEALRGRLDQDGEAPLRTGDFAVAAAARALRDVPEMNVAWQAGERTPSATVDVIVSRSTAAGSVRGLLGDADRLGLGILARRLQGLSEQPQEPGNEEATAGFSVLDVGDHGVSRLVPVVPRSQTAILALGAVEEVPVVRDGAVVPGKQLRCTLAVDARAVDADAAARWAAAFRRFLEDPLEMML